MKTVVSRSDIGFIGGSICTRTYVVLCLYSFILTYLQHFTVNITFY